MSVVKAYSLDNLLDYFFLSNNYFVKVLFPKINEFEISEEANNHLSLFYN